MNIDLLLMDFFDVLGCNMPALIMLIVAMGVTYSNRHRHPAAARWALLGFAWFFVIDLISIAWQRLGILVVFPNLAAGDPEETISLTVLSCGEALGYVFMLLALNAARVPYRPRSAYDEFGDDIDITKPR